MSGLIFVGWAFCSLVSVAVASWKEIVVAVCYLVGNASQILSDLATGGFG